MVWCKIQGINFYRAKDCSIPPTYTEKFGDKMLEYLIFLIIGIMSCYCCFLYGEVRQTKKHLKVLDQWILELEQGQEHDEKLR